MLTVLVVEDEPLVRHGIIHGVDWAALDCRVTGEAANGAEGLKLARALRPDLIITDIRTPRMDGIEMLTALRADGNSAHAIILTAYSDFDYARTAIQLHVSDYLLKPFSDRDLENAIRRLHTEIGVHAPAELPLLPRVTNANGYVQEAMAYISAHYAQELSITEIAKSLAVSESRLSHLFRNDTGHTITGYWTRYRIQTAMELLRDHRVKVYEVASLVGYRDVAYFGSLFKKLTGKTPGDWQMSVSSEK
ncbi:MAG: response regulator [Candidatus Limiplasma sp.]|jgi:two-component system response regulator YesN|nr:response regulator [Candidatus Limiplasma sp.]